MTGRSLPWLDELQARYGALLRTPLDRSSGTLRAPTLGYDPALTAAIAASDSTEAAKRLSVYHRQYWFRLFTVLQEAYPLTTRLLGHWDFNRVAASFLQAHPPRHWDLDEASSGLVAHLTQSPAEPFSAGASKIERLAVLEAATHDRAFHDVFRAPEVAQLRPTALDQQRLTRGRLVPSPATAIVEEHWPLMALRKSLPADGSEAAVPLPERLEAPRYWLVFRAGLRVSELELEPGEARLFTLLGACSVSEALGKLEAECAPRERSDLPARVQRWLARSMELDLWSALAD